jgi:hypothetical protein
MRMSYPSELIGNVANNDHYAKTLKKIYHILEKKKQRVKAGKAEEKVDAFHRMLFHQKLQLHSLLSNPDDSFSGIKRIDRLLLKMIEAPTPASNKKYGSSLLTSSIPTEPDQRSSASIASKNGTKAPSLAPPISTKTLNFNGKQLLKLMLEILMYTRAHYFEIACALAFMSGRSLGEILVSGKFQKVTDDASSARYTYPHSYGGYTVTIPLLCEYHTFNSSLNSLRQRKDFSNVSERALSQAHTKSANLAMRRLTGQGSIFTDARAYYAMMTLKASNSKSSLEDWVRSVVGDHATAIVLHRCQMIQQQ